jgi:two-component system cell cycle response regulator DivK
MRLPGVDGVEVSRRLRAVGFPTVPIIAVSACVFEPDVAAALESGCDAFLAKPCLPETVVHEIKRLLALRARQS